MSPRQVPEIRILFMDEDLVVCDKPPGMNVHRGEWSQAGDLHVLQTLRNQTERKLFPVHRLDRNSSGVLAFALSTEMAAALQARLQAPEARKRYLVLGRGHAAAEFESTRPLRNHRGEPQACRTVFRCLEHLPQCSLLEASLYSGRKHQIRRHLNHLAHHVLGDSTYGKGRINQQFRQDFGLPRMFLHACELDLAHPRTGEWLQLKAPLAQDLALCLERLRAQRS
ncbi:MAG: pseudouridylate synthase [Planctomycetota bacterium]|nr:MAG: pseudouridylate synthase [Planctomycetota bacterium]